ncbi:2-keto-4-pentenoate hydratase, partial [Rhodococcus fascians]|nr:2-keto-4-pentenoate hydratase [Rhodococcus fascians]
MSTPQGTSLPPTARAAADAIGEAAERLSTAAATFTPCTPVRDLIGTDDVAAAYAVQERIVADRIAA